MHLEDPDSSSSSTIDSAAESLNSLLNTKQDGGSAGDCLDVDVKCSLSNQCEMSCEQNSKLEPKKSCCCSTATRTAWGVFLVVISVAGFIYTPQDFMLREKLNMRPGFPPYDWWSDPPDEVRLRVHVFNYTNHQRFLDGLDEKLNVEEIGPIVYLEKLLHYNISFNENSTMTYTSRRYTIYLEDENNVDLNATIVVPNMAVLGLASYLHDANFMVQAAFRLLVSSHGSQLFVKKTIYEFLWDYRDPVLDTSKNLAPALVPVNNMGMLARIYSDFTDEVTVKIGPQWGHRQFFHIDQFRGQSRLPGFDPEECPGREFGPTEGVMYSQHLTKEDVLLYWRKTACKVMPLYYDASLTMHGIRVYRYNLTEGVHSPNHAVCHNSSHLPDSSHSLQSRDDTPLGVSDASKCYYDFPMVISYPHFYAGEVERDQFVTGLKPDRTVHNSYAIVEPLTGTPLQSVARMQSNLYMRPLHIAPPKYKIFSRLVLPLCWAEYNQASLPLYIRRMVHFTVVVLPPASIAALAVTLLLGGVLLWAVCQPKSMRQRNIQQGHKALYLTKN